MVVQQVGVAGGMLELLGQVGAAAAGWPVGVLSETAGGWIPVLSLLCGCCLLSFSLSTASILFVGAKAKAD